MTSLNKLNELLCSYSNSHFVKCPIALQCGHPACKDCLKKDAKATVKCMKCNSSVKKNVNNSSEFGIARTMIKLCLSELFAEVERQTTDTLAEFKGLIESFNDNIDAHFQFVQDEIEIKIESVKIELDGLLQKYKNDLENIKTNLKNENGIYCENNSAKVFEDNAKKLRIYCKSKELQSEEKFYEFQDILQDLRERIKNFEDEFCNFRLKFRTSNEILKEELVGRISFCKNIKKNHTNEGRIDLLKEAKYQKIEFSEKIREFCVLPDKLLLCATDDSLKIYDSKFTQINEVREIESRKLRPCGIAVNKRNQIYLTNTFERILVLDFNFRKIKSQSLNSGSRSNSICCKNEKVFICDKSNQVIQLFNLDLRFIDSIQIDYDPVVVRVSDFVIGVSSNHGLFFYDIESGVLNVHYKDIIGRLSEDNSQFYAIHSNFLETLIYVFDKKAKLIEKIEQDIFSKSKFTLDYSIDGQVFCLDSNLYINCYTEKRLLEF